MLNLRETRDLYRRRAGRYDAALRLYPLIGFRLGRYRRLAVDGLALRRGDAVVDLGCGTGLNFPLLAGAVGPGGRVIGVDATGAMLERAGRRVARAGWRNVELVQSDVAAYAFPEGVGGVLSTLAVTMVAEFYDVTRRAAGALRPGGRVSLFELKLPERWPGWLVRLAIRLNRPWGVSPNYARRRPWASVGRHFAESTFTPLYFGAAYVAVGRRGAGTSGDSEGSR